VEYSLSGASLKSELRRESAKGKSVAKATTSLPRINNLGMYEYKKGSKKTEKRVKGIKGEEDSN